MGQIVQVLRQAAIITTAVSFHLFAETVIDSGAVSGDWNKAGSPYRIKQNIRVDSANTLTIGAGVEVLFESGASLAVYGNLRASGAVNDTVRFRGADSAGWGGVAIGGKSTKIVDSCEFNYCSFSGAKSSALRSVGPAVVSVSHCLFRKNANQSSDAGAISSATKTAMTIDSCVFAGNSTNGGGGAIRCNDSTLLIKNSRFTDNSAGDYGGALYALGKKVSITGCDFLNNSAKNGGGAIANNNPTLVVSNSSFVNNSSGYIGGALYSQCDTTMLTNCLFANNAGLQGGAVYFDCAVNEVNNCTIVNNYATNHAGGVFSNSPSQSSLNFQNTIFFGNAARNKCNQFGRRSFGSLSIRNCIIDGGVDKDTFQVDYPQHIPYTYENNLVQKPLFKSPNDSAGNFSKALASDWQLLAGSAGIDSGRTYAGMPQTDIAGNARVSGAVVDIGAYEYQYPASIHGRSPGRRAGYSRRTAGASPCQNAGGNYQLVTISGRRVSALLSSGAARLGKGVYIRREGSNGFSGTPSYFILVK